MDADGAPKSRAHSYAVTLAGAMAPVTMAGAVAQSIAEALCAVV